MRILLSRELSKDVCSTNDRALSRVKQILASTGGALTPLDDARGADSLLERLNTTDLFALDTEHRILAVELLIEWMLDFDTMDDYMHASRKRAHDALCAYTTLAKQQKQTAMPTDDTDDEDNKAENGAGELKQFLNSHGFFRYEF